MADIVWKIKLEVDAGDATDTLERLADAVELASEGGSDDEQVSELGGIGRAALARRPLG